MFNVLDIDILTEITIKDFSEKDTMITLFKPYISDTLELPMNIEKFKELYAKMGEYLAGRDKKE